VVKLPAFCAWISKLATLLTYCLAQPVMWCASIQTAADGAVLWYVQQVYLYSCLAGVSTGMVLIGCVECVDGNRCSSSFVDPVCNMLPRQCTCVSHGDGSFFLLCCCARPGTWKHSGYYIYQLIEQIKILKSVNNVCLCVSCCSHNKQRSPAGLCSGGIMCFLWGANRIFI
jgi:hypothetical protein